MFTLRCRARGAAASSASIPATSSWAVCSARNPVEDEVDPLPERPTVTGGVRSLVPASRSSSAARVVREVPAPIFIQVSDAHAEVLPKKHITIMSTILI